MMPLRLALSLPILFTAAPAWADANETTPQPMKAESCFPIEGFKETLDKFDELKPSRRDTVGPDFSLAFMLQEGEPQPERVEIRGGYDAARPVAFDAHHRSIGLTDMLRATPEDGHICAVDPAREGRMPDQRGYDVDMGMAIRFLDTPGTHTLEQIEDGLKDGRRHYKKMAGAMGFMVPKFDHIAVAGRDADNPPRVFAVANGADIGEPESSLFNGGRMIAMDALEGMGADGIRVDGDYYRLSPSPSEKVLRRFMGGGDEDEG